MASVVIERTRQMSSSTEPMCGKRAQISVWFLPNLAKRCGSEADQLLALELRQLLALGETVGHRLAVHLGELRFRIERFELRRSARHGEPDDALGFRREVRGFEDPARAHGPGLERSQQARQGGRAQTLAGLSEERAPAQVEKGVGFMMGSSGPGDGFVQVQEHPRHVRPRRELRFVEAFRHGSEARLQQLVRRLRIGPVRGQLSRQVLAPRAPPPAAARAGLPAARPRQTAVRASRDIPSRCGPRNPAPLRHTWGR